MKHSLHRNSRTALALVMMLLAGFGHAADESRDDKKEKEPHGDIKSLNGLTGRVTLSSGPGVILTTNGNGLTISALPVAPPNAWRTTGNAGTTAGVNFLGTTDSQPLELWVHNSRVMRLEFSDFRAPNIIAGAKVNFVNPGTVGATIAGGGSDPAFFGYANSSNSVCAGFGTIGGGVGNTIQQSESYFIGINYSVIGGGWFNTVRSNAPGSVIGGGKENTIGTLASICNIGGGDQNTIGNGSGSVISGGLQNTVTNASYSSIGGGNLNTISAGSSFIGGGGGNTINGGVSVIGGGSRNSVGGKACFIGGGQQNSIELAVLHSTIAGGFANGIQLGAAVSAIGGGTGNFIQTNASSSTIAGGENNTIESGARRSAISGGAFNAIGGPRAGVRPSSDSTIGGGSFNIIDSGAEGSVIGGGGNNAISRMALGSTISGGGHNFIGSGSTGNYAAIPGGDYNWAAGANSFAAGHRAQALQQGTFVWADSTDADVASTAANQFTVRASGGVRFFSDPNATVGVQLAAGGNSWAPSSDRNLKENFQPANPREVLDRVVALPIQTYNMRTQDPSIRHIGPMAQDFAAAFAVGEDDRHIATVDADGVALAAIQGLNEVVKEKDGEIQRLKQRLDALEKLVTRFITKNGAER